MNEEDIGRNIRNLRQEKGKTLTETAKQAGLTKSTLSKIETGQISPPISTVLRIADALAVPLSEFFAEPNAHPDYALTRKGQGTVTTRDGTEFGYSYESLALNLPDKLAEPFLLTISPDDPPGEFQHGGQEFIYLLEGKLEFTISEDKMVLNPGDSIYFNPRKTHTARAVGRKKARFLCMFMQDPIAQG